MTNRINGVLLIGFIISTAIAAFLFFNRPVVETVRTVTEVDTTYVVKTDTLWPDLDSLHNHLHLSAQHTG